MPSWTRATSGRRWPRRRSRVGNVDLDHRPQPAEPGPGHPRRPRRPAQGPVRRRRLEGARGEVRHAPRDRDAHGPGGAALRRRIDDMSNEEYQALIRIADGAELRRRLSDVADPRPSAASSSLGGRTVSDDEIQHLIANLGGHDLPRLLEVLARGRRGRRRAGGGLRLHRQRLRPAARRRSAQPLAAAHADPDGRAAGDVRHCRRTSIWAAFPPNSPAGQLLCGRGAARLAAQRR